MTQEYSSYFLCSRRDIPALVARAEATAEQILRDFSDFYKTAGKLEIKIEPKQHIMGFSIGGKLTWDGEPVIEEDDCGLLFLQLNDVIINRMLKLGFVSFNK